MVTVSVSHCSLKDLHDPGEIHYVVKVGMLSAGAEVLHLIVTNGCGLGHFEQALKLFPPAWIWCAQNSSSSTKRHFGRVVKAKDLNRFE